MSRYWVTLTVVGTVITLLATATWLGVTLSNKVVRKKYRNYIWVSTVVIVVVVPMATVISGLIFQP